MTAKVLRPVTGDDSRLTFLLLASLRSHVMRQPLLTGLTTMAVALAIALVIALGLSSRSVDQALSRSANALKGKADLEVTAGGVGVPEHLLGEVENVPGIANAAPVVETVVRIVGGLGDGKPLRVVGVDLLADQSVRDYSMIQKDLRVLDPLRLVASSDSVIISKLLADQLGVSDGSTLKVLSSKGEHQLVVRGLLSPGGMGDAYAGQIAVMDVYALQAQLGQQGWFDRIDLLLDPTAQPEQVTRAVSAKVEGVATVRQPVPADQFLGAAISTIRLLATTIALAGTLVAGILCYASIAASVDRRVRVFGLLRAAGLEPPRIRRLVYADSIAVAVVGTALGVPLGWSLSGVFESIFSEALSFVSGGTTESPRMSVPVLLLGAGLGIGVSFLSAALAARRSTRMPPHEAMSGGRGLTFSARLRTPTHSLVSGGILLFGWLLASSVPLPVPAICRFGAVFLLGVALVCVVIVPLQSALLSSARLGFERWMPGIGRIAAGSLLVRLYRTQIATISLAALIASASSLWIVTTSVLDSVDRASSTNGGTVVATFGFLDGRSKNPVTEKTVREVSMAPGVAAVFQHFVSSTIYRGDTIRISAITPEVWADRIGFDLVARSGSDAEMARALHSGSVFVYDSFQRRFGLGVGDSIRLDTPTGPREFSIVGVRRSYSPSPTGGIQMDLSTFDQIWPRQGVSNLIVWPTTDEQQVMESLQKHVEQPLFVLTSAAASRTMRSALDAERALVLGLLAGILVLAGAAVGSLMLTSAFERRGDLALLNCIGASRSQLLGLVLLQSATLGAVGGIAGLALGLALVPPLSGIVTDLLGWVISWSVDVGVLALLLGGTFSLSILIGVVSAVSASNGDSWNTLAPE